MQYQREAELSVPVLHQPHISHDMMAQRVRIGHLLYRHVHEEDVSLTDMQFLRAVARRVLKARAQPLIDPNE